MPQVGEDWIDPRPARAAARPAPRPDAARRRHVVFFDNGKLSPPYDRWTPIEAPLVAGLRRLGDVVVERSDLLMELPSRHPARVADWCGRGVDGVVFALCDAGVVQPTLLLAAAAEASGIPTAVICTDQVIEVAAVSAAIAMFGLPLLLLKPDRLAGGEALAAAAAALADDMAIALTADPGTLVARFEAQFPFVAELAATDAGAGRGEGFADMAIRARMTDGLPVVTPTRERVARAIACSGRDPAAVIVERMSPSGAALTIEAAAACAVMAGCTPERFPLVVAALTAMADPAYRLHLASITTHPAGNLVLVSGPAAAKAGIASGRGCLGPGHPANATVGRSIALTLLAVGRAIPGLSSLSLQGSPAQFTYCFADALDGPLPPLHTALGDGKKSIVWVSKCEGPHNVMDHLSTTPRALLTTFARVAATVGGNNAFYPCDLLVILNPEHADVIVRAGWRRPDVQEFLWEVARNSRADLAGRGAKSEWPPAWDGWDRLPVVPSPDRIWVVVAGAPGPHSAVAIPWGYAQAQWRCID